MRKMKDPVEPSKPPLPRRFYVRRTYFGLCCAVISILYFMSLVTFENFAKSIQQTKVTKNDRKQEELQLCRIYIHPQQKKITPVNKPIEVPYQCDGPAYSNFSKQLIELASNPGEFGKDVAKWGRRRSTPVPPNSSVVFLGNSHMRQVFQTFMCQYQNDIRNITRLLNVDSKGSGIWDVRLEHNITVFGVFNVPHVYSPRWHELLTKSLNVSFNSIDALVLGKFNTFKESKKTSFLSLMKNLTAGTDSDFERTPPADINAIARVYSGPILSVSMFAAHDIKRHKGVLKKINEIKKVNGRSNIFPIDGRQYVPYLGECATDSSHVVGTCLSQSKKSKRYKDGHRCVGNNGGHPDLIAWDIVEGFYRLLENKISEPTKM